MTQEHPQAQERQKDRSETGLSLRRTQASLSQFSPEEIDLLKQTICKGATDLELELFVATARRLELDPFLRQIHAVKRWDAQAQREVMSIQVGIDGYRAMAERTGEYAGIDEPVFDTEEGDHPGKATVTVYRWMNGQRVPFTASARYREYVQLKKDGHPNSMWTKMPWSQCAKCAESLALRKAFPSTLSLVRTDDEMGAIEVETESVDTNKSSSPIPPTGPRAKVGRPRKALPQATTEPPQAPAPDEPPAVNDVWDKDIVGPADTGPVAPAGKDALERIAAAIGGHDGVQSQNGAKVLTVLSSYRDEEGRVRIGKPTIGRVMAEMGDDRHAVTLTNIEAMEAALSTMPAVTLGSVITEARKIAGIA